MAKKRETELDLDTDISGKAAESEVSEEDSPSPTDELVAEEGGEEGKPVEKKLTPKMKIVIIGGLVFAVIIMAAVTAFLMLGGGKDEKPKEEAEQVEAEPEAKPEPEIVLKKLNNLSLEPFILTYDGADGRQMLKISLTLHLSNKDAVSEIDQNLVIIRDAIFFFIKNKEIRDFTLLKRRKDMLLELRRLLDRSIQNGRVVDVLITEMNIY